MDNLDFIRIILINLILTILGYCTIPIILRILNGKYEYEKGHKIVLINCAIVWLIFTIIKVEQGMKANSAAVFLYYMIDRAILLKEKREPISQKEELVQPEEKELADLIERLEQKNKKNELDYEDDIKVKEILEQKEERELSNLIQRLENEQK